MQNVGRFELNTVGRDFIVGDIHGMYNPLMKFLDDVELDEEVDRLFSVGDLIDRGNLSFDCLKLIYQPWFHVVHANHEDMMIEGLLKDDANQYDSWMYNGGSWLRDENLVEVKLVAKDFQEMAYKVIVLETPKGRVNIVHAELYYNADSKPATDYDIDTWNFHDINETNMVWGRTISQMKQHYKSVGDGLSITYCGHTPAQKPFQCWSHRFIDTGFVFSHTKQLDTTLTIVDVTNDLVYSVNKRGEVTSKSCDEVFINENSEQI